MVLSDRDRAMLDLAGRPYAYQGVREQHITEQFDLSATRFWQLIDALLDVPEARALYPVSVGRMLRFREQRRRERSAQRMGIDLA